MSSWKRNLRQRIPEIPAEMSALVFFASDGGEDSFAFHTQKPTINDEYQIAKFDDETRGIYLISELGVISMASDQITIRLGLPEFEVTHHQELEKHHPVYLEKATAFGLCPNCRCKTEQKCCPKAKIIVDRFHVQQHRSYALDEVRKRIQRQCPEEEKQRLKLGRK